MLIDLKNRGVRDVRFLVREGLKGLTGVVESVWPLTIVQTCIIHLIRNTFRLTSRKDSDTIKRDVKLIYTARTRTRHSPPSRTSKRNGEPNTGCGSGRSRMPPR